MQSLLYIRMASPFSLHGFVLRGIFVAAVFSLIGCTSGPNSPASRNSQQGRETRDSQPVKEVPADQAVKETQTGSASFISEEFQGKQTASGDTYNQDQLVAAHPSYPLGTVVRLINLENGRTVEVRVIDRSPKAKGEGSPIIDVSRGAAEQLEFTKEGQARVRVEALEEENERREP